MSSLLITPGTLRTHPYPWEDEAWVDSAAKDLNRIGAAFDACGVDRAGWTKDMREAVAHVFTAYSKDFAPFGDHSEPRPHALRARFDAALLWLRGITVVEEDVILLPAEVPLCAFNCPDVPDAKTSLAEATSTAGTAGWNIDVMGSGFGSDMTLTVSQTNTFVATAGERKLVFAPLQIRVVKVALHKRGQAVDRFLKCEVAESEVREANGLRSVDRAEWPGLVGKGKAVERFDLSKNKGSGVTTYERARELSGIFQATLGLTAFNLKSTVTTKCSVKESVALKFELPAGHVYRWKAPTAISGFLFD